MKIYFSLFVFLVVFIIQVTAQTHVSGCFKNASSAQTVTLNISNSNVAIDTIMALTVQGAFDFDLSKLILEPSQVILKLSNTKGDGAILFRELFVAPSYKLNVTGTIDAENPKTIRKSLVISGKGSSLNYLYPIYPKPDTIQWINKPIEVYLNHLNEVNNQVLHRADSLLNGASKTEKEEWRNILKSQLKYVSLHNFMANYGFNNDLNFEKLAPYFKHIGIHDLWTDLNDPNHLKASSFRYFISSLSFLVSQDLMAYPVDLVQKYKEDPFKDIFILNELLHDKVKDYALYQQVGKEIRNGRDVNRIKQVRVAFELINNEFYQTKLNHLLSTRLISIDYLQPGSELLSEIIVHDSRTGKPLRIQDFKGKIVYIESWASWCGPCKQEIPYMRKLVDYYKNNKDIVFVSLAVRDFDKKGRLLRQKIMTEQQMDWMQLEDLTDAFYSYFKIKAIPHNIILAKDGTIIDNDGYRPSSADLKPFLDGLLNEIK